MRVSFVSARAARFAAVLGLALASAPVVAGTVDQDADRCMSDQWDATNGDSAERIAACSHVISEPDVMAQQPAEVRGELYYERGVAYFAINDNVRALADFDQTIALDPKRANAHAMRAYDLMQMKRNDEALASANRALALDAANKTALAVKTQIGSGH